MLERDADEPFIDHNVDELVHFTHLTDNHRAYYAVMESTNTRTYTQSGTTEVWNPLA